MRKSQLPSQKSILHPSNPPNSKPNTSKPIQPIESPASKRQKTTHENVNTPEERVFACMYRKPTNKKHKSWEGDGFVVFSGKSAVLKDSEGKDLGKSSNAGNLNVGDSLMINGKEVELDGEIPIQEYLTGKMFLKARTVENSIQTSQPVKVFKNPLHSNNIPPAPQVIPKPRHDPNHPNALIMPTPSALHSKLYNPKRLPMVQVVVDPVLSNHLRPHQRQGVRFLYECCMGMKHDGNGAILADDMGLGKTIQAITLIWTLLKQNPCHGIGPVVRRALVVCPASLVGNWQLEFKKWLGDERIRVFAVDQKSNLQDFLFGKIYSVMIIGYEKLRSISKIVNEANFDLIVCDEGHRLKSESAQITQALTSIPTKRRVILSGTPIQNDLTEFYNMVNFVNDSCLGSPNTFKKVYEDVILEGRQPNASKEAQELGKARSEELTRLTSLFILRRTSELNQQYLPSKTELVVFIPPSTIQLELYEKILESTFMKKALQEAYGSQHFRCITALKKLCNHPILLSKAEEEDVFDIQPYVPTDFNLQDSGKFDLLIPLLTKIKPTGDKLVLVSNYTSTLDMFETICKSQNWPFVRLDGSTPANKRTDIVTRFNSPHSSSFIFLLSTKAGGQGLNLIGANRLILFDIDWNPAMDLQAQARIWRDGQRKPVVIYRFLTTGTIEEKIYQRQVTKIALSETLLDEKEVEQGFSMEDLKDVFTLHTETNCQTHDLLECDCENKNTSDKTLSGLLDYQHLSPTNLYNLDPKSYSFLFLKSP